MDFSWSKEQLALRAGAVDFARRFLRQDLVERDRQSTFSRELWRQCAEFGVQGSAIPEEYGGLGQDLLTTLLVMEGLGHGGRDNGLLFALAAQMWSVQHPILVAGSEEQKRRYLPALCRGELIGAHGMTEPDSGSDAYSLRTTAVRRGEGYVLDGTKTLVTNAPEADLALIFASTAPERGRWGISAFLVERGLAGFSLGRGMAKMGLRTSPIGELVLEKCFVPESARLGKEGAGAGLFEGSMERERAGILGSHLGAMERQLEECVAYARERQQFGQPIGRFQAVSHRIAEMKVRLETSRLMLYKVAWLADQGKSATTEAAIAKLYLGESFVASSLDAIKIHGGYGYLTEMEVERDLRDAIGGTLYSGTSDIQRNLIAHMVGLK